MAFPGSFMNNFFLKCVYVDFHNMALRWKIGPK
jgi:hypothetical protein